MLKLIVFITLLSGYSFAQSETIVYGKSTLPDGQTDSYLVEQPDNAPNPLGNPIVMSPSQPTIDTEKDNTPAPKQKAKKTQNNEIYQIEQQDPPPFSETPQEIQNKIENTLYQSGSRIYDVQSYPIKDIKEITQPNIDPTITTYPEY